MLDYTCNFNKESTVILNIPGKITIDNTLNNKLLLEVDYNSFSEDILNKIKKDREELFETSTNCVTYNTDKKAERNIYIRYFVDGEKKWYKVLSENNSINFSMIKNKVYILKNGNLIESKNLEYSKMINFSLNDGVYIFRINTYTLDDELINTNDIQVILKKNYYSFNSNNFETIKIPFGKDEGDFSLELEANSKKLYSFKVTDIKSENDSVFEFTYYNADSNEKLTKGQIGSDLHLLNDKQIEEIIKNPIQEQLIKPEFVFDIKEIFTTKHSKDDIGIIKIPTIKSKLRDTGSMYYDLKCDVTQNYVVDIDKTKDFLITDKFSSEPLFYKFMIHCPFKEFKLLDNLNKPVEYILESITDNLHIVYFNPLRNKHYYAHLDNYIELIQYKKSYESFKIYYDKNIENSEPFYFGDLMVIGEGTYNVTIVFEDYNKKTFTIKGIDKECKFLEDERIKIDNNIIGITIDKEFKEFINMICPLKNNRTNYSFFKKNNKDFVYIAKEVNEFKLEEIPNSSLSNITIGNKYIYINGILEEVLNGPIYLEEIKKADIVFTDIETWVKENTIGENTKLYTEIKDDYFNSNVVSSNMEVIYEDK